MTPNLPAVKITGIGSVSPYGTIVGHIPQSKLEPSVITAWKTTGLRRAFLVEPFRPADVVPGLKTRRLDRLSAWALVASSLAIQDAGLDLSQVDRSRVAVIFATGYGCVELTAAFYQSAAANGWSETDPNTFPETLANSPASHVAMFHDLRGPNITVGSKSFAGESALLQAASLLRHGQADLAIVLAGDTLTRAVYEWYEVADLLSPACYNSELLPEDGSFIPSEGVTALVLESPGRRQLGTEARSYAYIRQGRWTAGGQPVETIRKMLAGVVPSLTICAGNGAPCATSPITAMAREIVSHNASIVPPQPVAAGLADTGALLHFVLALSNRPSNGLALLLGTSIGTCGNGGFAAVLLELP